ncbi:hypothetical protein RB614_06470 [Phytohabitans sp. ZYX-F-186]|uniref:Uncharacterized protein n=1 Tax=Phytohabitans maris TaxID=3071409 RepID=A0ABU0ZAT9_9ACTN|nr:hypothetical protein [Phytohabitans sp. ZYX-F-186]MDQ7904166.1 hypothetical protein [Phytohabitans sp. ZYX-F-186]
MTSFRQPHVPVPLWDDPSVPAAEQSVPFRWDLVTPDQLGSLLRGTSPPDLWFLDDLVACTGKVLARSGNGDLVFVGRSLDSMFDLLGGALAGSADGRGRTGRHALVRAVGREPALAQPWLRALVTELNS